MTIPAATPWLVNELGEPLCTVVAPPLYSYDPNGGDLPRGPLLLLFCLLLAHANIILSGCSVLGASLLELSRLSHTLELPSCFAAICQKLHLV